KVPDMPSRPVGPLYPPEGTLNHWVVVYRGDTPRSNLLVVSRASPDPWVGHVASLRLWALGARHSAPIKAGPVLAGPSAECRAPSAFLVEILLRPEARGHQIGDQVLQQDRGHRVVAERALELQGRRQQLALAPAALGQEARRRVHPADHDTAEDVIEVA